MKKINNKGFAISVLIYSLGTIALLTLLIILGTLSGMRKNESKLVEKVKSDLNAMSSKINVYSYKEEIQEYKVLETRDFTIELWGGSGGSPTRDRGGLGGYVRFNHTFSSGTTLYIVVGDEGKCPTNNDTPTSHEYTTGGKGYCTYSINTTVCGCDGGGASIIAVPVSSSNKPTSLEDLFDTSKFNIVAVAAGGGGAGSRGGFGGPAWGSDASPINGTLASVIENEEMPEGNIIGTTSYKSGSYQPGLLAGTIDGAGVFGFGGSFVAPYYKGFAPASTFSENGYSGSGGGGGYYGGGASTGSYSGAGGGSNFCAYTPTYNIGGSGTQMHKDLSGTETNSYQDLVGDGKVVIYKS